MEDRILEIVKPTSLHSRIQDVAERVAGIDLSKEAIDFLKSRGMTEIYAGDVETLSASEIPHGTKFSLILAGDIIEHLANPGRMLDGARQFLEPSGELIITTPNCYGLPNYIRFLLGRYKEGPEHVQSYSQFTLANLVTRYGWNVTELYTAYEEQYRKSWPLWFALGSRLLGRFPKLGGTLIVVCHPQ